MKMTETDKEMFKALHGSGLGANLLDYSKRFQDYICDSRSNTFDDVVRTGLAKLIDEFLIDRITLQNEEKKPTKNPYV